MPFVYDDPRPLVTVVVVAFSLRAEDLAVLLVRRSEQPFKGAWELPGGEAIEVETVERTALRELQTRTQIAGVPVEQLGAFGDPGRDPRGHAISIGYFTFVVAESHPLSSEAEWIPLRELPIGQPFVKGMPKVAFDHASIVARARQRLQERLNDPSNKAGFELVPPRFTLTELQHVYEAVFGRTLDKRNFRARLFKQNLVEPVSAQRRIGRHRPAQLYRWKEPRRKR